METRRTLTGIVAVSCRLNIRYYHGTGWIHVFVRVGQCPLRSRDPIPLLFLQGPFHFPNPIPDIVGVLSITLHVMPDLHTLPEGSRPGKAIRNNGPDHLALERYKLRELAEGWPLYR